MDGNRIKQLRKEAKLTQSELGEKLGVVKQTISSWENNISEPNGDTLLLLSKLLNTSPQYLLGGENNNNHFKLENGYDNTVKYWIFKSGYGYGEVASKLGISEDLLMDYMNKNISIPYKVLADLSELCEVSTDCLLGMINKSREKDFNNILPFCYNYEIARRIKKLCEDTNTDIKSSFLENLLCLSAQEIFYLVEYGFVPHMNTIIQLAQYFHVSTDYLLCQINVQEDKLLSTFTLLSEDNKDIIVGEMKKCLKEQRYESVAADEPLKQAK